MKAASLSGNVGCRHYILGQGLRNTQDDFAFCDMDHNLGLDLAEFSTLLQSGKKAFPEKQMTLLFTAADVNHDGMVSFDELSSFVISSEVPDIGLKMGPVPSSAWRVAAQLTALAKEARPRHDRRKDEQWQSEKTPMAKGWSQHRSSSMVDLMARTGGCIANRSLHEHNAAHLATRDASRRTSSTTRQLHQPRRAPSTTRQLHGDGRAALAECRSLSQFTAACSRPSTAPKARVQL